MKNKRKIWKIIGGLAGIATIACIIPACVVSCGSSTNPPTSTTNPNPATTDANLVSTSVNGNATQEDTKNGSTSSTYFYGETNSTVNIPWFNFYYLNKPNTNYTISLSTDSNLYSYQWYQVPIKTIYSDFGIAADNFYVATAKSYPSSIKANESAISFLTSLATNSNMINGANSPTYQFKYGVTLDDAIYFCRITNGNNSIYSQVTWLQAKTPFNPLDVSSYTLAVTSNNGQNQENTNTNTLNITNNTKVSLNLSVADSNNYEMTSDNFTNENYYALYTFNVCSQLDSANEYQVFDLSNSNAWNYTYNVNILNNGVSAAILNQNGQIIAPNSADDSYITMNISNDDPLNLSNTSISLSTTAKTVATTNSFGENAYQINVKPGTKLTFTLNINKLTYKDFANSDYYINWLVQNPNTFQDELESIVLLSNASSWTFTFNAPSGQSDFSIGIENGSTPIVLSDLNASYIIDATN